MSTLFDLLGRAAARDPDRICIDGPLASMSYREALSRAEALAGLLLSNPEVTARRAVGICSERSEPTALAVWAAVRAGIDVVFLPRSADPELMRSRMLDGEVDFALGDEPAFRGERWWADIAEVTLRAPAEQAARSPLSGEGAFLFQTSGTSGDPKWVRCEYGKCGAAVLSMQQAGALDHAREQNVFLTPPLFHSYGLSAFFEYTSAGATVVFPRGTSPFGPAGELRPEGSRPPITAIEGVPYFYSQMARLVRRLSLDGLRHLGLGGGALDPQVMATLLEVCPDVTISVRYGLTETPSVVSHRVFHPQHSGEWHGAGRIVPAYEVTIESEDGQVLEPGEEGEIIVRGACVCAYRGKPAEALRTGDVGYLSPEGELTVVGRRSAFLKYRGFRLSPESIESVLLSFAGIEDCRVDVIDGTLVAEVVHADGVETGALVAHAAVRLPVHAVPEEIRRVSAVPRTASGKIKRHRTENA